MRWRSQQPIAARLLLMFAESKKQQGGIQEEFQVLYKLNYEGDDHL